MDASESSSLLGVSSIVAVEAVSVATIRLLRDSLMILRARSWAMDEEAIRLAVFGLGAPALKVGGDRSMRGSEPALLSVMSDPNEKD